MPGNEQNILRGTVPVNWLFETYKEIQNNISKSVEIISTMPAI